MAGNHQPLLQERERRWPAIQSAPDADTATPTTRARFVETLDFDYADQPVPLNSAAPTCLPMPASWPGATATSGTSSTPTFPAAGPRRKEGRRVARRDQPRRAGVQQIANLWRDYDELGLPI